MTQHHLRVLVPALAASMALTACGSSTGAASDAGSATVSVVDSQGRTVDVPVSPDVVVATDWSAIRTLADLGVDVDAVPAANGALPTDLAAYDGGEVPTVGDVFEPDYEAIAAMQPDLVIVGSRSGTPEVVAELEKFAPAVVDLSVRAEDPAEVWAETRERVEAFGAIFDKTDQTTAMLDDLDDQMSEVRSEVEASEDQAMMVQVSDGTVSAYGPGSRFGSIYEDFGYTPTDAPVDDGGSHGEEVSQEFFVEYDPDVLFVLDRAKAIGQTESPALDVLDNGLVGTTQAAQDDRIVEVDGFSWYLAASAPSSWQQMIDDVRASI